MRGTWGSTALRLGMPEIELILARGASAIQPVARQPLSPPDSLRRNPKPKGVQMPRKIDPEAPSERPTEKSDATCYDYPITGWTILKGAHVEIRKSGVLIRLGYVEATTTDGTILWLSYGQGEPRQMFEKAEGHEVWASATACAVATSLGSALSHAGRYRSPSAPLQRRGPAAARRRPEPPWAWCR